MKTIAIDLDDTLNDFTHTLREAHFEHDESFGLSRSVFDEYLGRIKKGESDTDPWLSTEWSYFRARIHLECYRLAKARPDGIDFMRWLRSERFRIVICTRRDLRRAYRCTKTWLDENGIPFDYLFTAGNKIVFCKLWEIEVLVDDDLFNIEHGGRYGVSVYYPRSERNRACDCVGARGFSHFDEVRTWMVG